MIWSLNLEALPISLNISISIINIGVRYSGRQVSKDSYAAQRKSISVSWSVSIFIVLSHVFFSKLFHLLLCLCIVCMKQNWSFLYLCDSWLYHNEALVHLGLWGLSVRNLRTILCHSSWGIQFGQWWILILWTKLTTRSSHELRCKCSSSQRRHRRAMRGARYSEHS